MGVVIRQSIKASFVTYIGVIIGYLNVVLIYPYCLTPELIGLNKMILDSSLFLAFFVQLGIPQITVRFFPKFQDSKNNNHGFFFLVIIIPLIGFVIFSLLFFFLRSHISGYFALNSKLFTEYILYVIPLTLFLSYINALESYSSCLLRIVVPKLIREVLLKLMNIIIIILFFIKIITLNQFILFVLVIYGIAMILNFIYLKRKQGVNFKPDFTYLDKPRLKEIGKYAFFILLGGMGTNLVSKFDVFMISSIINLSHTGIFGIATYIVTIVEIPSRSLLQISAPIVSDALNRNDISKVKEIYKKTSLNQFVIGGFIFLLLWINVDNIFHIMPNGTLYQQGKYVILFLGVSKLFDMITGVNGLIIANSKFYFYLLFLIMYLTIVSIAANYIFIPIFGINGAGIANLCAIGSYNLLLVLFLKWKMKIQPFSGNTIKAIIILSVLFLVNLVIPLLINPYLDALFRTSIIGIIYIAAVLFFKVSDDINQIWKQILDKSFFDDIKKSLK